MNRTQTAFFRTTRHGGETVLRIESTGHVELFDKTQSGNIRDVSWDIDAHEAAQIVDAFEQAKTNPAASGATGRESSFAVVEADSRPNYQAFDPDKTPVPPMVARWIDELLEGPPYEPAFPDEPEDPELVSNILIAWGAMIVPAGVIAFFTFSRFEADMGQLFSGMEPGLTRFFLSHSPIVLVLVPYYALAGAVVSRLVTLDPVQTARRGAYLAVLFSLFYLTPASLILPLVADGAARLFRKRPVKEA